MSRGHWPLVVAFAALVSGAVALDSGCGAATWGKGDAPLYPALFLRYVDKHRHWLGEDIAFSKRAEAAGVPIHVLADTPICHAGRWSRLNPDGTFSVDRATPAGDYNFAGEGSALPADPSRA